MFSPLIYSTQIRKQLGRLQPEQPFPFLVSGSGGSLQFDVSWCCHSDLIYIYIYMYISISGLIEEFWVTPKQGYS